MNGDNKLWENPGIAECVAEIKKRDESIIKH